MARIVVLSEGFAGRAFELKPEPTTIGRVEDNAFPIAEPSVSSHHCEIFLRGNDVVLKDLNSTNGSFVNGQQITGEAILKPGQIFRLGQVELRLESAEAAATPPPAKKPEQTKAVSKGVSLTDLDQGTRPVAFEKDSAFTKKSNKGTAIFIGVAIVVFLVIVGIILYAVMQSKKMGA